jgi:CDP-diglyceride synthetase
VALNKEVFKTRTLTAAVFVAVMLTGLFVNGYTFLALCTIILFGCLYEFAKIIKLIKPSNYRTYFIFALPYIIIPLLMLIDLGIGLNKGNLKFDKYAAILPCAIFLSIWANDTMAYLVGSFIGKKPFTKKNVGRYYWRGYNVCFNDGLVRLFYTTSKSIGFTALA